MTESGTDRASAAAATHPMRIVFMGTPDFSVPALDALIAAGHQIVAVYTQPPRPAGRGKKDRLSPVHRRAAELGLPIRHPASLKSDEAQAEFAALRADIGVVVAYGLILPQACLDVPREGCLNIHASLLPRWRGAAPIHRAVLAGDVETGVCIMQMDAGLDTGPVLLREATPIGPEETTGVMHDRLSETGARLIVAAMGDLQSLTATPQPEDGVSYAAKIDKAESRIDWTQPALKVDRQIRGMSPAPGAWCLVGSERVKMLGSRVAAHPQGNHQPGDVLDGFRIACGTGAVEITKAQRQGKAALPSADLLRGWSLPPQLG